MAKPPVKSGDLPLFAQFQTDSPATARPAPPAAAKSRPWTVSELNARIKGILEPTFTDVWVQGEISNFRPAASGHVYFSLKDEGSMISAAIFGWGQKQRRGGPGSFEIQDGMQVLCRGKISVYPPRGNYQILVEQVEPLGAGALQLAFEQLKTKLQREGLFDPAKKRPLPRFPTRIAVVTSPSGAAIRDMLNILSRRAPQIEITIVPAVVQGDDAPRQILRGLELANRWDLGEVVVLARGGGSIEDLWCFNDETLARAIAASRLPTISAVGHEIDFTIADFVADLRAPTPSAAAEIVSGHWVDTLKRVRELRDRTARIAERDVQHRGQMLRHLVARLVNPRDRLREQAQRTDEMTARLERALRVQLDRRRSAVQTLSARLVNPGELLRRQTLATSQLALRLERALRTSLDRRKALLERGMGQLDALSPLRVLERGYTLVREPEGGKLLRTAQQASPGRAVEVVFHDGKRKATFSD